MGWRYPRSFLLCRRVRPNEHACWVLTMDSRKTTLDTPFDQRQLRNALGRFPTGVTVITTRGPGGKLEGMTANSFSALSLDPPLVLWSISTKALSLPSFIESGHFCINVLPAAHIDISHRFATPRENKYDGVTFESGLGGSPVLSDALATFECKTETTLDAGDHLLFIGRAQRISFRDGEPLVFSAGQYCTAIPLRKGHAASDLKDIWEGLG